MYKYHQVHQKAGCSPKPALAIVHDKTLAMQLDPMQGLPCSPG